MTALLELSNELLHHILVNLPAADLSAVSRTCKDLSSYIRGNKLLHKDIFIKRYDYPSLAENGLDWESALHDLTKFEKILESENRDEKDASLAFVADRLNFLLTNASTHSDESLNVQLLNDYFASSDNIDAFLTASSLFSRAGGQNQRAALTPELRQASAKMHCQYGVPILESPSRYAFTLLRPNLSLSPSSCTRLQSRPHPTHAYARAKVYDLREYTDGSLWGPFMEDGSQRIDWEKVEAVMMVLGFNMRKYSDRTDGRFPLIWTDPCVGATPNSFVGPSPTSNDPEDADESDDEEVIPIRELGPKLNVLDPYGVTGTWMRIVCFLDYNELYNFNFHNLSHHSQPREPIDTEEAIRLIRLKWQVTKIEPPGAHDDDEEEDGMDWSNFQGQRLPIVHFAGKSRSLHASWDPDATSKIRERGTVRQTPEGEIRWTTFSIFHGEERWRSESIQIGGLRSARGIIGNWFDKDYDVHGPAGPTALWKESDDSAEEKPRHSYLPYF